MGPAEENKNKHNNTTNPPNTTKPNHLTGPLKRETVKRAPALIVSEVTPARHSENALFQEALSLVKKDWIPCPWIHLLCHSERFLRKFREALFVTVGFHVFHACTSR